MYNKTSLIPGQLAASLALFGFILIAQNNPESNLLTPNAHAASQEPPKLTPALVDWVSRQAESVIGELEAIARANANSDRFSVINYVRYLELYDHLTVIARKKVDKLNWVSRKVAALSKAHRSASEILSGYLSGLDASLSRIEHAEPLGKAVSVNAEWLQIYQTIRYIAAHVPRDSKPAQVATEMLGKSPNGTPEKRRDARYKLATHAFN